MSKVSVLGLSAIAGLVAFGGLSLASCDKNPFSSESRAESRVTGVWIADAEGFRFEFLSDGTLLTTTAFGNGRWAALSDGRYTLTFPYAVFTARFDGERFMVEGPNIPTLVLHKAQAASSSPAPTAPAPAPTPPQASPSAGAAAVANGRGAIESRILGVWLDAEHNARYEFLSNGRVIASGVDVVDGVDATWAAMFDGRYAVMMRLGHDSETSIAHIEGENLILESERGNGVLRRPPN